MVAPCLRHNPPKLNGHVRGHAEVARTKRRWSQIVSEGFSLSSNKLEETDLALDVSNKIAEYNGKIARGKSSSKEISK